MEISSFRLVLAPVAAFAICVGAVPFVKKFARWCGAVASPSPRSKRSELTPLLGGIAIIGATLAAAMATGAAPSWTVVGALMLLAVGMVDDVYTLNPRQKFAMCAVVAVATVFFGPHLSITGTRAVDIALETFWLIATANAFNLIDGLDGLASGIGVTSAVAIAAVGLTHHDAGLALWALALGAALTGFLIYNFHPASIFMGDTGALSVGYLLGIFSLQAGVLATNSVLTRFAFPLIVMFVPLLDTTIVSLSRLVTGEAISRHGYDHSHHRLQTLGLSDRQVTLVSWGVAGLACALAVITAWVEHAYVLMLLPWIAVGSALVAMFMIDLTFESRPPGLVADLPALGRMLVTFAYKRRIVEIALDAFIIAASYSGAFLIRLDFNISPAVIASITASMPAALAAGYAAFLLMRIYRGIWRYLGLSDSMRFAAAALCAGAILKVLAVAHLTPASGSIDLLFTILLFDLLVLSRASFIIFRKAIFSLTPSSERVLIVGAGRNGAAAADELTSGLEKAIRLVGFADDDPFKWGKLVAGRPVFGPLSSLDRIHDRTGFTQILVATALGGEKLELIQDFVKRRNLGLHRFSIGINPFAARSGAQTVAGGDSEETEAWPAVDTTASAR